MFETIVTEGPVDKVSLSTRLQFALCLALVESILTDDEVYSAIAVNIADDLAEQLKPNQVALAQQAVQCYLDYLRDNNRNGKQTS